MDIGWSNNPSNGMKGFNSILGMSSGQNDLAAALAQQQQAQTMANGGPNPSPNAPGTNPIPSSQIKQGADPTQYYKPPDRTDPRYINSDSHWTAQQRAAYEAAINSGPAGHDAAAQIGAASWADYDKRRTTNAYYEQEGYRAYKAAQAAAKNSGTGVDAPVYDPDTDTFSYVDKDGKWTHGVSATDIYSKLTDDVKKQYPEWYFPEYQTQQQQNKRTNLDAAAYTNQSFARMGQQSTRYSATSL